MRFIATLIALAGSACATAASLQGARALAEGESAQTVALTASGAAASSGATAAPGLAYLYRGGLGEGFDYSFQAWLLGLSLGVKQEVLRDGAFSLAWSPAIGAAAIVRLRDAAGDRRLDPIGSLFADLSLYATRAIGEGEVTLQPRLVGQLQQAVGASEADGSRALQIGFTLGGAIPIGAGLRLRPEVTALWTAACSGSFAISSRNAPVEYGQGSIVLQAALGVAFGR